jgi:outer membrane murein-binding lipoprotein Lpp
MNKTLKFFIDNFKVIMTAVIFIVGLYVQHEINTQRIDELEKRCQSLDAKLDQQYQKIDAIKLDKSVFEATIKQFSSMGDDIREIRNDIKEVIKSNNGKK